MWKLQVPLLASLQGKLGFEAYKTVKLSESFQYWLGLRRSEFKDKCGGVAANLRIRVVEQGQQGPLGHQAARFELNVDVGHHVEVFVSELRFERLHCGRARHGRLREQVD